MNKKVFRFRNIGKDSYYAPGDKRVGISNILIFPVKDGVQLELPFAQDDDARDPEYLHSRGRYSFTIPLEDLDAS